MSDIFDEILNDAKDEKKLLLFRKILPIVIVATIIIAVFIASYNWYQNKVATHNKEVGDLFVELLSGKQGGNDVTINSLEDLIKTNDNKQSQLAELAVSSKYIGAGDYTAARSKLESIVSNKNYDDITTAFARVLWLNLILDESAISDDMQTRALEYLEYFKTNNQPFFGHATLIKALFYKKNGQNDLAIKYAEDLIKMEDTSSVLKEQAKAILSSI